MEQRGDVSRYAAAAGATETKVVRLVVPHDLIPERLSNRDRDGDRVRELARSLELAELMEHNAVGDAVVENGGTAVETASEVLRAVGWLI